jgi:hypothetical protein
VEIQEKGVLPPSSLPPQRPNKDNFISAFKNNFTLFKRFADIKCSTEQCPFAKAVNLWGGAKSV